MPNRLRIAVTWITLAPVVLVGGLGTGLHGLLGCQHGPLDGSNARCCKQASRGENASGSVECHDCGFCQRRVFRQRRDAAIEEAANDTGSAAASANDVACCDGCAVCDLLMQYHSASSATAAAPLPVELLTGEAPVQLQNAVVSAATRLAFSRGPPTA